MLTRSSGFNLYLRMMMVGLLGIAGGCALPGGTKPGSEVGTLRLHLEESADGSDRNGAVPIYREKPILVNVGRQAFLTEADLVSASVVEDVGGFSIRAEFSRHGALVLDQVTSLNLGRRIAVKSDLGNGRWLAAPRITNAIRNGVVVFSPDASREEAERIVRGLNAVAKKSKKQGFEF